MQKSGVVNAYILRFPSDVRIRLEAVRTVAHEIIPDGEESISYGVPTIKKNGKYVLYFAGFAKHISIYPILRTTPGQKKKIQPYLKGKGTLQFPHSQELPMTLIREVIQGLLADHTQRTEGKKKT